MKSEATWSARSGIGVSGGQRAYTTIERYLSNEHPSMNDYELEEET